MSIETLVNLDTLFVEELVGHLKAAEERYALDQDLTAGVGELVLMKEEWRSRSKGRGSSGGGSSGSGDRRHDKGRDRGKDGTQKDGGMSHASRDDECRYCGKKGHWARECKKKKRDEAHLAHDADDDGQDDYPALLMAVVTVTLLEQEHVGGQVFLNETRAEAHLGSEGEPCDGRWYLDSGASNHMSGNRVAFTVDEHITGSVKFGDGSTIAIRGPVDVKP
jgi:hypothetical protein